MMRPLEPDRIARAGALIAVAISVCRRIAAFLSFFSKAAVSTAYDSSRARDVLRGNIGMTIAARSEMIASVQMTSIRVKPRSKRRLLFFGTADIGS
jgi:hypothetical protein